MTNKQNRSTFFLTHIFHLAQTLLLELRISHSQHFVHYQYLRLKMCRNRKGQAHIHTTAVSLNRGIKKFFHFRKLHYFIKLLADLYSAHAKDSSIQKNIFSP